MESSHDKPPEAEPSTQAANLTDTFCNYAAGLTAVREDKRLHSQLQSSAFRTALATWLSKQCDEGLDDEEMQSGDAARGSRGPHTRGDGSTVVLAAAAAAKPPGVERPVVDPKPASRPAAKQAAKAAAKPDATRDAPVPLVDGARCMAEVRPPHRDGRRKALTDKAQGNGTAKAPTGQNQGERPVLNPTREVQRQEHNTATPRRGAERSGCVEPSPVRTNLSSKPGRSLPGVRGSVTPARALAKARKAPLAEMLAHM